MKPLHKVLFQRSILATFLLVSCAASAASPETSRNILPEGAFDAQVGQFYEGWKPGGFLGGSPAWNNAVTMESEPDVAPFVRIRVNDEKGANVGISQTEKLVINPAWKTITLKAWVRMKNYQKVADWGGRGQFSIKFSNENDEEIPGESYLGISKDTAGWVELSKAFPVPQGSTSIVLNINLIGALGVMDVKKLEAIPAD